MAHHDTNDNKKMDFITDDPSFSDADYPYFTPQGKAVIDKDKITEGK